MKTIPAAEIKIGKRFRSDLGDIGELAESIAKVGLLHPIVIDRENRLIAGRRRLAACKALKWDRVPVHVVALDNVVLGEHDENVIRKDFTISEKVAIGRALEPREREEAKARKDKHGGTAPGKKKNTEGNFPSVKAQSRDKVGRSVGLSGRTYEKAKAVIEAAESDPKAFGEVAAEMDRTGKVDKAYREVKKIEARREAEREAKKIEKETGDDQGIRVGDFRDVKIDPGSASLIFTDPPYDRESLPLYGDLAKWAATALRDGGSLVVYAGHYALPEILNAMMPHLTYWWTLVSWIYQSHARMTIRGVFVGWKPVLWFVKGTKRDPKSMVSDVIQAKKPEKTIHDWEQPVAEAEYLIDLLTRPGELVIDPMCGSGTTLVAARNLGRRGIGIEISKTTALRARRRLHPSD